MFRMIIKTFLAISAFTTFGLGQSAVVPIVELESGGLLGGVKNGMWVSAKSIAPLMKSKTEFTLVGWNGVEEGGVSLADFNGEDEACGEHWSFTFELEMKEGVGVATNAKWNLAPREVIKTPSSNKVYRTAIAEFIKTKGIRNPVINITAIYRVDLDGDGSDEILISADRSTNGMYGQQKVGDYSFTLLRKMSGTRVVNFLLEGEFFARQPPKNYWPRNEYKFSGVADLNGDGKMEIIVSSQYYEGGTNTVFQIKNGKPVEVKELSVECGV
jgi:hypothetical protein